MQKRHLGLILGGCGLAAGLAVGVLAVTHRPAAAPETLDGGTSVPTTTTSAPLPALDPARLRSLLPSTDDLGSRYSAERLRNVSKSGVRSIPADSPDFGAASAGVIGGVEQVFDAYNSYYQSDTTVVVRVALFRSPGEAAAFVAGYDKPARLDNATTRDSVPVSTFEYSQDGRFPSVAESMSATGHLVIWVKIVDADALSIYTGVAFLIVEDAVVEAIDTFPEVAARAG